MDSLTHLALGAILGETLAGKKLGKKAMAIGAGAQFFPDVDFIAALWLSPTENLIAHRGLTHSIAFNVVLAVLFSWIAKKKYREKIPTRLWLLFFGIQLGVHIFIDTFNAYGVGLLEPFSAVRISLHALYVADPLFSIWLWITVIALLLIHKYNHILRIRISRIALGACSVYLCISLANKLLISEHVKSTLQHRQIKHHGFITTPTPFNNLLWYVIIKAKDGYYTGYRSVFDNASVISLTYFKQHPVPETPSLPEVNEKLITLSQDYYIYSVRSDTLRMNILPFGQVAGWENPDAPFVLVCDLLPEESSLTLLQEGRAKEMNTKSMSALLSRIFHEDSP